MGFKPVEKHMHCSILVKLGSSSQSLWVKTTNIWNNNLVNGCFIVAVLGGAYPRNSMDFLQCKEFSPGDIEINGSSRKFHGKSFHRPQFANEFPFHPVSMLTQWWLSVRKSKCLCIDACINTAPQKKGCRSVNIHLKFAHQTNSSISSACNKQANVLEKQSISWRRTSTFRNNHIVSHFLQEQLVELQTITNMHGVTQHLVHLGLRAIVLFIKWCSQGKGMMMHADELEGFGLQQLFIMVVHGCSTNIPPRWTNWITDCPPFWG